MNHPLSVHRGFVIAAAALCAAVLAFAAGRLVLGNNVASVPSLLSPPHARHDLSIAWHIGPTLRELQTHFAVLRRPATAREHAMLPLYASATTAQPLVPEYVRRLGVAAGQGVDLVIYPVFKHGASGPVVAYEMTVSGNAYIPGNYLIFPTVTGALPQARAYVSVVPDGIRAVTWRFTCGRDPSGSGCELPGDRVVSVPVRGNLAVLPVTTSGAALATVNKVTWYRTDGSRTTFTNQNRAVPFPGAPARQVG